MGRLESVKPLVEASRAVATVAARRARTGPKRPCWSFRYEALVELIRNQLDPRQMSDLSAGREGLDRVGDREARRNRSTWEEVVAGGIPSAWIRPKWRDASGTVLYLHGGGYVIGSPRSHRGLLGSLAVATGTSVLGVDYRLAPEHSCPAAVEDALAAYRWLLERHTPESIVVAGDSAGGGLSLAFLVAARDEGLPLPAGAVLLSPWVDLTAAGWGEERGFDYIHPPARGDAGPARAYAGDLDLEDPRVSPIHADLRDLPPLLVLAGELELIVEQSRRLAAAAREAGVEVHLHVEPDELHVYPVLFEVSPRAQAAFGRIDSFLDRVLATRH